MFLINCRYLSLEIRNTQISAIVYGLCTLFTLYGDITIKACVTNDHGCVLHCTVILQSRPVWQKTTDVFYIVQWYYNQGLCDKWPRMCFTLHDDITIKTCVTNDHGCVLHCTMILQSRPVWQMTTDVFYIVQWYYNQGLCDKWPRMCFTLYGDITIKACVTNDHGCVLHCTVILQSRPVWQMTTDVFYIVRWYYNQGLCDKWPRMCFVCRNHNQKLSSFMAYHQILNRSNTTGATSETGTTYPCGTPDFIPIFSGFRFSRSLVFCVAFYRPLLVFFFVPFLVVLVLSVLWVTASEYHICYLQACFNDLFYTTIVH
jgi:uncharacterized protein (DUF2164 family)